MYLCRFKGLPNGANFIWELSINEVSCECEHTIVSVIHVTSYYVSMRFVSVMPKGGALTNKIQTEWMCYNCSFYSV